MTKLYEILARKVGALHRCEKNGTQEGEIKHRNDIVDLANTYMPSGSGIDNGSVVNCNCSTEERLVITTGYHHMDGNGYYDGWTEHEVIVTPSLVDRFHLRITGRDRNNVKEYLHAVFSEALNAEPEEIQLAQLRPVLG